MLRRAGPAQRRQGSAIMGTDAELALGVSLGRIDGRVTRDEALAHVRIIATATDCPVSADLEKGFGDAPADVAETIRLA